MSIELPEFNFIPPPEAPVFKPTWEEFQDALGYINKIRPIAEQTGICKIVPPPDWQPPFAVDVDNFKFTPRIQRLNELEAHTRIKLNFLDQIAKFWELQGSSLKIPVVERKALDLYTLHQNVQSEGGLEWVNREKKWTKIQLKMGYPSLKNLGPFLKGHYERIIHPFHIFNNGKSFSVKREVKREEEKESAIDKDYKPHKIPSRMAGKIPDSEKNGRRSRRHPPESQGGGGGGGESKTDSEVDEDGKGNKELKRLQFYGAGPKMAGFDSDGPTGGGGSVTEEKSKTRGKKIEYYDYDPLAKYICLNCGRGDAEDQMLLCDGCDDSYHTFCLVPRLPDIPKGDWRCPKCVAVEVSKPVEAFGFEQAQKEYTLQSFGEMADKFKQDYFNMPVHLVPLEVAEKEFWRVVSSIDEDVTVEYGADLHTMDHGSGFPTRKSKNLLPADQEYATCSWNLNNIPIVEGSVLGHINCDISGMKVPWMYVGMCFSTFCWHNEDHWSYSINYLHWGEPKTWYGVPGPLAEAFEKAMAGAAPELFSAQPDLLHQLVTIMNPNIIMKAGVPIYRTNQHAGEFVITFPRSYHAGFNQGYNFAEAVNFCSADWLSIGRECISHYSNLKRYCVFSHDELVCKMASSPDRLDLVCAAATYQDILKMVDIEKILRKALLEYGIRNAEREAFELLPDDERQCDFCKTTCFLSAVTCGGGNCSSSEKLVCLRHYKVLCECPPESKTLRYRYTLDELPPMLDQLKVRAESFDSWAAKVKEALEAEGENKLDLPELRDLVDEAENHKFPDSELLQTLVQAVTEAEKCAAVASHLAAKKVRTRMRGSVESKAKLTVEELTLFCEQVESLACQIKEGEAVRDFLQKVLSFKEESSRLLSLVAPLEKKDDDHREGDGGDDDTPDSETLSKLLETGLGFDIDLPELAQLKNKVQQLSWLEETEENMEDTETLTVEAIRKLLEAGVNLPPSPKIERLMGELQALLTKAEQWEEMASKKLAGSLTIEEGQALLEEGEGIPAHMNAMTTLKDALKKSREWVTKVEAFQESEHAPLLELVENVVAKGRSIPFRLVQFSSLEENVSNAHAWLDKTARTFLKKTSHLTLLEVLLPRADIGLVSAKRKKVKKDELSPQQQLAQLLDMAVEGTADPAAVVKAYKECEERELRAMRAIRAHNKNKSKFDDLSTFCICHRASHGAMNTCALCCNQFHVGCIPMYHRNKMKMGSEGRFICISCERSKRPRLEMILSLLVSLQRIPIRLPEAEALQCLTERAMLWQDRARTLLQVGEVAASMAKLTSISEQMVEAKEAEENEVDGGENNKGAYDAVLNDFLSGHTPLVSLSPGVKQQVQDLLVEGELLEVFLDECCHLWRLLQAVSHPPAHMEEVLLGMAAAVSSADGSPPAGESSAKPPRKSIQQKRRSNSGSEQPSSSSSALLDQTSFSSSSRSPAKKMRPTSAADKSSLLLLGGKGLFPTGSVLKKKASSLSGVKQSSLVASGNNNNGGVKSSSSAVRRPTTSAPKSSHRGTSSSHHADAPWLLREEGSSDDDESADESADEECAMRGCMRPYGSNVQWVQCDGCDLWFHYVCVGLCQKDISEDEEYLCASCCPSVVPAPPFKDLCPP